MDIDVVVLWVDGRDPRWKNDLARYSERTIKAINSENRFRDWGLMPYWFRAIDQFIPWVRKIHFVTCGHVPAFLKLDYPKLHHVCHSDFLPADSLPTFNSHAIEINLHRIQGLAERFLYFNDDTFLLRPLKPETFFKDGLPCLNGAEIPLIPLNPENTVFHTAINDVAVINGHFRKSFQVKHNWTKYIHPAYRAKDNLKTIQSALLSPNYYLGFKNTHAPMPYCKSAFEEVWKAEPELLHNTTFSRFRKMDNVNQWLVQWWQIASGQFSPARVDNVVLPADDENIARLCQIVEKQSHDMLCINDPDYFVNFEEYSFRLREAFEKILPERCPFEKA